MRRAMLTPSKRADVMDVMVAARLRMGLFCLPLLALFVSAGCAPVVVARYHGDAPPTYGESLPVPKDPIELSIVVPGKDYLEIGELRGRAGLLYFFTTFDTASQAMLTPLRQIIPDHPEFFFVGIAVQPDARNLVEAWTAAIEPPLTIGYEPRETLTTARSPVGKIKGVPTTVSVDRYGRPVEKREGVLNASELARMLEGAAKIGATDEDRRADHRPH